jgi:nucleotide-binding universal stress UspA family protein
MTNTPSNGTLLVCIGGREESETALRFACLRAIKLGMSISMVHILEPADFQGLMSVTDVIRKEKEEEARDLLNDMADIARQITGQMPIIILREGRLEDQIIRAIHDQRDVSMVVFGLRQDSQRGPKIASKLTAQLGDTLMVPLVLIPGNLNEEQLEVLA